MMENRKAYSSRFGEYLRNIRKSKNISLRELALEIESNKPTLSKIENGKSVPSVYFLKRICKGLDMSESEFFKDFK